MSINYLILRKKGPFFYHGIFLRFWRKKNCAKSAEKAAPLPMIFVLPERYFSALLAQKN